MVTAAQARALALDLPGVAEQDHHGHPSFRLDGRILATLWSDRAMNVMPGAEAIHWALTEFPDRCVAVHWGRRLAAVQVDLDAADPSLLADLLNLAWARRARERKAAPAVEATLRRFGLGTDDRAAWLAAGLDEAAFDDWLTDRLARRPAGRRARAVYGADDIHDFARVAVLDALGLGATDRLLEVGCGGGLLLRAALDQGAAAVGVDHSMEMLDLAGTRAPGAGLVCASAECLPFLQGRFTAVAMAVVFFFFPDPLAVLHECRRVLRPGGRLAVYTTGPELRGTPAAPEPLATRGHFHDDRTLVRLAEEAGFAGAEVVNNDGGQLLTGRLPPAT